MPYNYSKLDGLVTEKFGTRKNFAKALCISERSLSDKFNSKKAWKQAEIVKACDILSIPISKISIYFFSI